jgi:hypothetical protein
MLPATVPVLGSGRDPSTALPRLGGRAEEGIGIYGRDDGNCRNVNLNSGRGSRPGRDRFRHGATNREFRPRLKARVSRPATTKAGGASPTPTRTQCEADKKTKDKIEDSDVKSPLQRRPQRSAAAT